jgi:predicted DNA-binding transcriptional regulator AlpA
MSRSTLLGDASALGRWLEVSKRTVFRLRTEGKLPPPVFIGSRPRWVRAEIEAWIEAGCPPQVTWNAIKADWLGHAGPRNRCDK